MTTLVQTQYTEDQQRYIENVKRGSFDLARLKDDEPAWGIRAVPKNPQRG